MDAPPTLPDVALADAEPDPETLTDNAVPVEPPVRPEADGGAEKPPCASELALPLSASATDTAQRHSVASEEPATPAMNDQTALWMEAVSGRWGSANDRPGTDVVADPGVVGTSPAAVALWLGPLVVEPDAEAVGEELAVVEVALPDALGTLGEAAVLVGDEASLAGLVEPVGTGAVAGADSLDGKAEGEDGELEPVGSA